MTDWLAAGVVELSTQVASVIMILSGIPPCWHMCRTGDSKAAPYHFFVGALFNGIIGCWYGLLLKHNTIIFLNAFGSIINFMYILTYISVNPSKKIPLFWLLSMVLTHVVIYTYMSFIIQVPFAVEDSLGKILFVSTSVLILLFPALEVNEYVKQKSAADMSLSMLFGSIICCCSWLMYGLKLNDFYIYAPNIAGLLMGLGKLLAFLVYRPQTEVQMKQD